MTTAGISRNRLRLLFAVPLLVLSIPLLISAWGTGPERWQKSWAIRAMEQTTPGVLESARWRLDFDPEQVEDWPAHTRPELCLEFTYQAGGQPRKTTACQRYERYRGADLLTEELLDLSPNALIGKGDQALPRLDVHFSRRAWIWLDSHKAPQTRWHELDRKPSQLTREYGDQSELHLFKLSIDRPMTILLKAWSRESQPLAIAFDDQDPTRGLPDPWRIRHQSVHPGELVVFAAFLILGFGAGLVGLSLLFGGGGPKRRVVMAIAWVIVVVVIGEPLRQGVATFDAKTAELFRLDLGTLVLGERTDLRLDVSPTAEPEDVDVIWSFESSSYAPLLSPIQWRRPREPLSLPQLQDRLAEDVSNQLANLDAKRATEVFKRLVVLEHPEIQELGWLFHPAAVRMSGPATASSELRNLAFRARSKLAPEEPEQ